MRAIYLTSIAILGCGNTAATVDAPPVVADVAPDAAAVCMPTLHDHFDDALALAGLDRCSLGYTEADLDVFSAAALHDPDRGAYFDAIHRQPRNLAPFVHDHVGRLQAANGVTQSLIAAAVPLGWTAQGTAVAPVGGAQPLVDAVAALITARGGTPDMAALQADAADVPAPVAASVARLVAAVTVAAAKRDAAIASVAPSIRQVIFDVTNWMLPGASANFVPGETDALRGIDVNYSTMLEGALDLSATVEAETATLRGLAGSIGYSFRAATPLGYIVINDGGVQVVRAADFDAPIALLVDMGGDDVYRVPLGATADATHGVALAVDVAGNDTYAYEEVPDPQDGTRLVSDAAGRATPANGYGAYSRSVVLRHGAGALGIGMVFDLGGDDQYRSLRGSQGYGCAGIGVLYDASGNDDYRVEALGQGAAMFGIGLLLDGAGDDHYSTYTESQGFGFVRGSGTLIDVAGDDVYLGEPDDALYYSPQLPGTSNSSFVQGAGYGLRSDSVGFYMSGGIGTLLDVAGDDSYTAGVFGQGTGYWFGTGILADRSGADLYDGKWYVQGSAAHAAIGVLWDGGGDDKYGSRIQPSATSVAVGHDFSIGLILEDGGNDEIHAPGLSIGAGNMNGIGMYIDLGGNDTYIAGEPSCPAGNLSTEAPPGDPREMKPTVGLFVDVGGTDSYQIGGTTVTRGDNSTWTNNTRVPPITGEHSGGVDAAAGTVSWQ